MSSPESGARLGVALTGHWLALDQIQRLARRADELGYAVVLVDGDASLLPQRPDAPLYDPSVLAALALAATSRTRVGSIRLPAFWNPLLLARSLVTLQEASAGRMLGFFGAGVGRRVGRLGLPVLSGRKRVAQLDETLDIVRRLLAGETVSHRSPRIQLEQAFVQPPSQPVPLVVAAAGPQGLAVVERHADVWDANVPPLRERLEPLRARLSRKLETWIWVFARPGASIEAAAKDYHRHCPWFADVAEPALERALLWGEPDRCREQLSTLRALLDVDLPVLDLVGLDESAALGALEALAPAKKTKFS
ncbi:MAG: LLM class flavin-dependent oxidoreductase [Myxococcales bacterium]|nr:LLM class flavin-dependent oxidoreductase [Myxococcales bacterium]